MARRKLAARGLSYVDANPGRVEVYTFDPEVIAARKRIEHDYPRLQVLWDKETKEHLIVQHGLDGTDSLVFATPHFHEDLIRARIAKANRPAPQVLAEIDAHNEKLEEEMDAALSDKIGEAGEKLAHAFAADGLTVRPRMTPRSVAMRKKRTLRNFEAPTRSISNR